MSSYWLLLASRGKVIKSWKSPRLFQVYYNDGPNIVVSCVLGTIKSFVTKASPKQISVAWRFGHSLNRILDFPGFRGELLTETIIKS